MKRKGMKGVRGGFEDERELVKVRPDVGMMNEVR